MAMEESFPDMFQNVEARYRMFFDHSPDGIVIIDPVTARPVEFNEMAHRQLGYSREEFAKLTISDLDVDETPEQTRAHIAEAIQKGRIDFETRHRSRQGEIRNVHVKVQSTEISGKQLYLCIWRDITDHKKAEEALARSEEKFRKAFYTSPDAVNINRLEDGLYVSINPGFTEIMGYTEADIIGKSSLELNIWDDARDRQRLVEGLKRDGRVANLEAVFRAKDGGIRYGLMSASVIDLDGTAHILSLTRDITGRIRAEEGVRESEKKFRTLTENTPDIISRFDRQGRHLFVNRAIEKVTNLKAEDYLGKTNEELGMPGEILALWNRRLRKVFETAETVHFEFDFPSPGGVRTFFSTVVPEFDEEGNVSTVLVLVRDITHQKESMEKLRRTLGATVHAIAVTVETRDPYTAGHQRGVADLARSIATEMGLSSDRVDGIRMAAIVHDLGKISVPAEILSKPTRLTKIEFEIIKTHAQSGYDILREIEFPWPIARMVLEHHERMDGSGYPNGLKNGELLLESKILIVADVVESMASHRPYRAGLGIGAALEEIEKNRGILYDEAVVDACLRLFREKGLSHDGREFRRQAFSPGQTV